MPDAMQRVLLVCTLGKTPQVVTETIWALAHEQNPVIPDEVLAISTENYVDSARERLLGKGGGWAQLIKALKKAHISVNGKLRFDAKSLRVAGDTEGPVHDLRTVKDNERYSDCIFKLLKSLTDGADADAVQIILSVSGGRKSMVAISSAAMSLLARPHDRLIHVIVDEKLEDKGFHYPTSGKGFSLFDIPFVRTRGLLKGVDVKRVNTFDECRILTQERVLDGEDLPTVVLRVKDWSLQVGLNRPARGIDSARFLMLMLVMRSGRVDRVHLDKCLHWASRFEDVFPERCDKFAWLVDLRSKDNVISIGKIISETRNMICQKCGMSLYQGLALLPKSESSHQRLCEVNYPREKLVVEAESWFLDALDDLLARRNFN